MGDLYMRSYSKYSLRDPSMTRTIRGMYERKLAGLFIAFRAKVKEFMESVSYLAAPSESTRISFPDLNDTILYFIEHEITIPAEPIISSMVNESLKAGKKRAGAFLRAVGVSASLGEIIVNPRVYEIIRGRNLAALKGITDDMSKKISSELSEGILKGEDMRRLSKRITESTNIPIERARVMARTETMYAFNTAANEEYKAYGVGKVEWVAALDERMCDICGKYHGKIYPIDEAPDAPAHPNCRCVKIPYIEEVA